MENVNEKFGYEVGKTYQYTNVADDVIEEDSILLEIRERNKKHMSDDIFKVQIKSTGDIVNCRFYNIASFEDCIPF